MRPRSEHVRLPGATDFSNRQIFIDDRGVLRVVYASKPRSGFGGARLMAILLFSLALWVGIALAAFIFWPKG